MPTNTKNARNHIPAEFIPYWLNPAESYPNATMAHSRLKCAWFSGEQIPGYGCDRRSFPQELNLPRLRRLLPVRKPQPRLAHPPVLLKDTPFFASLEPTQPAEESTLAQYSGHGGTKWLRELLVELGLNDWLTRMDKRGQSMRHRKTVLKRKSNGQLELRIMAQIEPSTKTERNQ